jgi:ankyrin repeat protein
MDPIFEAILESDRAIAQLLRNSPDLSQARIGQDHLVETIPHWLYRGDTPLHLAAAALRTGAAKLLLENGAKANAENRRGATPLHYACDPRPKSGGTWDPAKQGELIELLVQHGANSTRSIKAAHLRYIVLCVRAALQLCVSFSKPAQGLISDWEKMARPRSIWQFSRRAQVELQAL